MKFYKKRLKKAYFLLKNMKKIEKKGLKIEIKIKKIKEKLKSKLGNALIYKVLKK